MPPRSRATRKTAATTAVATRRDGATADLVLTGLAPGRLCAYWTLPPLAGKDGQPALALYRVDPRIPEPHGMLIFLGEDDGLRRIEARDGTFIAELGIVRTDGRWIRLAASEPVIVPAASESAACEVRIIDIRTPFSGIVPHQAREAIPFLDRFRRNRHRRSESIRAWTDDPAPNDEPDLSPTASEVRNEILFPSGGGDEDNAGGWPVALRPMDGCLPEGRSA